MSNRFRQKQQGNEKGNHSFDDSYEYITTTGTGRELLDLPMLRTVEHGRTGAYRTARPTSK